MTGAIQTERPRDAETGLRIASITQAMASASIDAWRVHYRGLERRERGEDVIVLSVGDPDGLSDDRAK